MVSYAADVESRGPSGKGQPFAVDFGKGQNVVYNSSSWRGVSAHRFFTNAADEIRFRFKGSQETLCLLEQGERHEGETWADGVAPIRVQRMGDKMHYIPANCEWSSWSRPRIPAEFTVICFSPGMLVDDSAHADWNVQPMLFFKDSSLSHTIVKLRNLIDNPVDNVDTYAETLGSLLVLETGYAMAQPQAKRKNFRGGLSMRHQKAVMDYIETHIDRRIALDVIAELTGLSTQHFCRAFKETFGDPPYRYILRRRLQLAKKLLVGTDLPVTSVALATGFASSSHFAETFCRYVGITATAFRRNAN